ncbi:MAG: sugar ABC transporter permease [Myxococcota bacterium]|nr:sugar ABC transporter permease [Myxococcota bacterium]
MSQSLGARAAAPASALTPVIVIILALVFGAGSFNLYERHRADALNEALAQAALASLPRDDLGALRAALERRQGLLGRRGGQLAWVTPRVSSTETEAAAESLPFLKELTFSWAPEGGQRGFDRAQDKLWVDQYLWGRSRRDLDRTLWQSEAAAPAEGQLIVTLTAPPRTPLPLWGLILSALFGLGFWLRLGPWASRGARRGWVTIGPGALSLALVLGHALLVAEGERAQLFASLKAAMPSTPLLSASLVLLVALLPFAGAATLHHWTRGERSPHRSAYTYLSPALLSVTVLVFLPFILGAGLSLTRSQGGEFHWVGLDHFVKILSAGEFPLTHPLNFYFTLSVTILWTLVNVVLHATLGLALALLLNQKGLKLKGIYRALLIIPWAIPSYITALIWRGLFHVEEGLLNHILRSLGLDGVPWMEGFWTAFAANVATNTWLGFPFMMVIALGALQSIPEPLYEAARMDGASAWERLRYITLPLLRPAMIPALLLGSVWTFNMFNVVYLVSAGRPDNRTDILITEAYRWAFEQDRYGYAAAYSIIIFAILLAYGALTRRLTKRAEEVYR